jgi:hypothetical protein
MLKIIPEDREILFSDHFILPFMRSDALQKFDVYLQDRTHVKFILKGNKK